ncbi:hypothetical protein SAMD00019534_071640 [Acytostelium subglobosum LB1]|uniref:hypothetical protein n=1 Tax=Acytostelium subglobosum LB1 TaxID=1410327 RepID=UPI000644E665|nr:hypothetical protein SAMD00019534_071640 [Acytostelium subglobosum LB1]GAM23989.1 hypothetical protein SAMD00019534_071640 [Acytostelium subglobosum LB1]|eukprot:XP_012753025.1 hypothetical protein SAMD00019534_071640 [Acytostelium subglobosum LB1]
MFSILTFFNSFLLFVNAIAILNERFLNKIGWGLRSDMDYDSFQAKCITLIHNLRFFFRIPLVLMNAVVILFLLVLG